jgi:hypothetical protein
VVEELDDGDVAGGIATYRSARIIEDLVSPRRDGALNTVGLGRTLSLLQHL